MAIYHLRAQVIRRAKGSSAVAAAAYRSGGRLVHQGTVLDYTAKRGVDLAEIHVPQGAPAWMADRQALWASVEEVERRRDAQLAREIVVALPVDLSAEQRIEAARRIAGDLVLQGMVVDLAVHDLDSHNPHAHLLCSMRRVERGSWAKKKERGWNTRTFLFWLRKAWTRVCAALGVTVDERSYAERGVEKLATVHVGKNSTARARRGRRPVEEAINEAVQLTRGVEEARWPDVPGVGPAAPSALDRYRRLRLLGRDTRGLEVAWASLAMSGEKSPRRPDRRAQGDEKSSVERRPAPGA